MKPSVTLLVILQPESPKADTCVFRTKLARMRWIGLIRDLGLEVKTYRDKKKTCYTKNPIENKLPDLRPFGVFKSM